MTATHKVRRPENRTVRIPSHLIGIHTNNTSGVRYLHFITERKDQGSSTSIISLSPFLSAFNIKIIFFDVNIILISQNLLNRYIGRRVAYGSVLFDLLSKIKMEITFYILKHA